MLEISLSSWPVSTALTGQMFAKRITSQFIRQSRFTGEFYTAFVT